MRILLTGASGFLGSHLQKEFRCDTLKGKDIFHLDQLEYYDTIIHLAGENIMKKRWTPKFKKILYDSRILTTQTLISKLKYPPKHFLCASAIGYYGDHGDAIVTESTPPTNTFLSGLCQDWEKAASLPQTTHLRFGIILSPKGGALPRMLLPFKFFLGGKLGSGHSYISWVALEDIAPIIRHILDNHLLGPVNVTSPHPIPNASLTQIIGEKLHRPTCLSIPAPILRLLFGEMADALFLTSTRATPKRLLETGYTFQKPFIENLFD